MAMTAYLDESGTHGVSSAAVVLGGFLATEQGWTAYERELASLLQRHQVGYFHAKLLRKRRVLSSTSRKRNRRFSPSIFLIS